MITRFLQASYRVVAFVALGAMACSPLPPPNEGSQAGMSYADVRLTRLDGSPITLGSQEVVSLRVQATNLQSEPVADVPIEWSFIQAPSTQASLEGEPLTDATGVASVRVTMGDRAERLTVRASIPNGGAFVEWEIQPQECFLRGVPSGSLSATDAPANLNLSGDFSVQVTAPLTVRAYCRTDSGDVPVPNQKIAFQVSRAITGTSLNGADNPAFQEVTTNAAGQATTQLQVGATTGQVTVLAVFGDAAPVMFDVNVVAP